MKGALRHGRQLAEEDPDDDPGDAGAAEKLAKIAPNVALGHSGLSGDARQAVGKARLAAVSWWMKYGITNSRRSLLQATSRATSGWISS